jgi:hypothetical protein
LLTSYSFFQEFDHAILPSIPPLVTFVLSFASMIPCLLKLWTSPKDPAQFVRALVLCSFGSYMFGWHVHEKAVRVLRRLFAFGRGRNSLNSYQNFIRISLPM